MGFGDNLVVTCFLDENCFFGLFGGFAGSSGLVGRRGLEDDDILVAWPRRIAGWAFGLSGAFGLWMDRAGVSRKDSRQALRTVTARTISYQT